MQLLLIPEIPFVPINRKLSDIKLYLFSIVFSVGNLLLPMIVHTIPNGGIIFLPLFFFTLVAAYSEGFLTGILVAIASPLINFALTGMPPSAILPDILFKSIFLALLASTAATRIKKINIIVIGIIIATMQILGGLFDYIIYGNISRTIFAVKLGIPGMIIMTVGGYILLRIIAKMRGNRNLNK